MNNNLLIRGWLKRHGIRAVIPRKRNQVPDPTFDREAHRQRHVIEQTIGWFKLHHRLATR